MMEIEGPEGLVVEFPDGTDAATIDRVMSDMYAAMPKEEEPAYRGRLLPLSRGKDGKVSLAVPEFARDIWNTVSGGVEAIGDTAQGAPVTDETIDRTLPLGALSPVNPAARARGMLGRPTGRARPSEVPSQQALRGSAVSDYNAVRKMGVEFSPEAVSQAMTAARAGLEGDGLLPILAPKSFRILKMLERPPRPSGPDERTVASLSGLIAARRTLQQAAKDRQNPTERLVATRLIAELDRFTTNPDPASVVAGPARAAGALQQEANENYAAAMRSRTLNRKGDSAELQAAIANSGQNVDNAIRRRVGFLLDPEHPERLAGFSKEEVAKLNQLSRGSRGRNAIRYAGNLAGGGGGMGQALTGLGAVAVGGSTMGLPGAIAGAAIPLAGVAARATANQLTKRELRLIDQLVRSRSPLNQGQGPTIKAAAAAKRAALIRAFLLSDQQSGGGGF